MGVHPNGRCSHPRANGMVGLVPHTHHPSTLLTLSSVTRITKEADPWTYPSPVTVTVLTCAPPAWRVSFLTSKVLLLCFHMHSNKGEFIQEHHSSTTLIEERKNHTMLSQYQWTTSWVQVVVFPLVRT